MSRFFQVLVFCLCLMGSPWQSFGAENATDTKTNAVIPAAIESQATAADCTCADSEADTDGPEYVKIFTTPSEAADFIAPELETGSLIYTRGDCLAVRIYTRSPYTHVAAVVNEPSGLFVYDSMNPMGVRRLSLSEYLATQQPDQLHLLHPKTDFTLSQQQAFEKALENRIGTPYAVKHHLTGKRSEGIHCAEYVIDALAACDVMQAENPPRVSPASLLRGGVEAGLYQPVRSFAIHPPEASKEEAGHWYSQLWLDTCDCTSHCWGRFRKLVFCH
ncbi:MAG: hypothetical protein KDA65_07650 [Planctomycetaceae bacterium]|nr:hypothetical protein [Planctomycetaceae bacterium]